MSKSGGKNTANLLRVSGILFLFIGGYHVLRYAGVDLRFAVLTKLGSLIYGALVLLLSASCFLSSRK
jgi:hypothetical protein